ncbi:serine/threonine-protein kinase [Terracoccus sp. 273MFTsu3.1]|uniref:serine/threonine-protein kinase n=1 Tax=Terracoccus sp. 273MFTsu3.1 TaxID=1172188 RepID=UPI00035CF10F|nr:serine/threonine-protein kinase [Terracoccus sp. 273MFTsu3.1]
MTEHEREKRPEQPAERPHVPGHRVDAVIGTGASAVVWSGADATGRRVAIKVPHLVRDELDRQQSLAEQQVLLAVQHDHLVPLRSVVPLADGREALVFDLVTGALLSAMVRSRGHLRAGEVVTVLTPVCEAVAHLHAAGGVHADISPSNVTLTSEGRPVLLDLGAVRVPGREPGAVHGTTGYIAPEVLLGAAPDESSDVYALGAVAWFCLTGNGAPDTMVRLDEEIIVSHVGPELAAVIASAIDPEPTRRPGAAELAGLFFDAVPPEPVEVVVGADQASALTHRLRAEAGVEPSPAQQDGRRWPRRAATAALVAVPLVAAAGWARAVRDPVSTPPPGAVTTATGRPAPRPAGAGPTKPTQPTASTQPATSSPASARPTPAVPTVPTAPAPDVSAVERVLRDAQSPSARPEELLQALSDRRSAALVGRDPTALGRVHATGSPSLSSDQTLVSGLVDARTRWEGLRLEVAEAAFVTGSPTEAVVRARVDWTAYVVVTGGGARLARPADVGRQLDFRLTRGSEGWRISAISASPTT